MVTRISEPSTVSHFFGLVWVVPVLPWDQISKIQASSPSQGISLWWTVIKNTGNSWQLVVDISAYLLKVHRKLRTSQKYFGRSPFVLYVFINYWVFLGQQKHTTYLPTNRPQWLKWHLLGNQKRQESSNSLFVMQSAKFVRVRTQWHHPSKVFWRCFEVLSSNNNGRPNDFTGKKSAVCVGCELTERCKLDLFQLYMQK